MATVINIQGFPVIGENPGQVKIIDALAAQIPVKGPQQRVALRRRAPDFPVGFISERQLRRAQRFGRRHILAGLQKVVILGAGQFGQPRQPYRTPIPDPGHFRQQLRFLRPVPGAVFVQIVARRRGGQFVVQAENCGRGSFLPITVRQSEKGRPAQGRGRRDGRQPRLFPAQDPALSQQRQLRAGLPHQVNPPVGKEGKEAVPALPYAQVNFIKPVQIDDKVELAAQQQGVGYNYRLLRLFLPRESQFENYRLPRPAVGGKPAAQSALQGGVNIPRYRAAEQTDDYRVLPPLARRHCIQAPFTVGMFRIAVKGVI